MTALENAHEMAKDLYKVGAIDKATLKEFEDLCLIKKKGNVND